MNLLARARVIAVCVQPCKIHRTPARFVQIVAQATLVNPEAKNRAELVPTSTLDKNNANNRKSNSNNSSKNNNKSNVNHTSNNSNDSNDSNDSKYIFKKL